MKKSAAVAFIFLVLSLLTSFRERSLTVYQKNVVQYFREIALGFEYGTASPVVRKWSSPMRVYVAGRSGHLNLAEVDRVITELNGLFTDGFHVERITTNAGANMVMFFGSAEEFSNLHPADAALANENSGLYRIFWNSRNQITRGHIFIKTIGTSSREQRSVLREELTQALGLGKDSERYSESIFQSAFTTPVEYAPIDRELVRILYHPRMTAGLTAAQADDVAETIVLESSILE